MLPFIVAFVVLDLVVMALVIRHVLRRRSQAPGGRSDIDHGILDLGALSAFARSAHERVGGYMSANYSGDPTQLAQVMPGLLDQLEQAARAEGLRLDRHVLLTVARQSILKHDLATSKQVAAATAGMTLGEGDEGLRRAG